MARLYLVEGTSYTAAERAVGLDDKKGFATMNAMCKLGAFRGPLDRRSMDAVQFDKRLAALGLS